MRICNMSIMTGILSRRREFAVLQAVGMTNRQLKTMLIYEGLFYAMSSVAAAFMLSLVMGPLAGKMLGSMFWFFEYRFTILPATRFLPPLQFPDLQHPEAAQYAHWLPGRSAFLTAAYCVLTPFATWIISKNRPKAINRTLYHLYRISLLLSSSTPRFR